MKENEDQFPKTIVSRVSEIGGSSTSYQDVNITVAGVKYHWLMLDLHIIVPKKILNLFERGVPPRRKELQLISK